MQMRGDSDSSLVVLWWSDWLGFGKSGCLLRAIFDQIQPNLIADEWAKAWYLVKDSAS